MDLNQHKSGTHIMVVEDNEADIFILQEIFNEVGLNEKLSIARNGAEAIDMVLNAEEMPDIIFLDINLPKKNGFEVLETLKSHPKSQCIPIIMLTTSTASRDIEKAYRLHANSYLSKANSVDELIDKFNRFKNYWIDNCHLPLD